MHHQGAVGLVQMGSPLFLRDFRLPCPSLPLVPLCSLPPLSAGHSGSVTDARSPGSTLCPGCSSRAPCARQGSRAPSSGVRSRGEDPPPHHPSAPPPLRPSGGLKAQPQPGPGPSAPAEPSRSRRLPAQGPILLEAFSSSNLSVPTVLNLEGNGGGCRWSPRSQAGPAKLLPGDSPAPGICRSLPTPAWADPSAVLSRGREAGQAVSSVPSVGFQMPLKHLPLAARASAGLLFSSPCPVKRPGHLNSLLFLFSTVCFWNVTTESDILIYPPRLLDLLPDFVFFGLYSELISLKILLIVRILS